MKPVHAIAAAAAVLAVLAFLGYAGPALTPFVLAAVLAYILAPLAAKLEARNLPPSAGAAVCVVLVVLVLVSLPLAVAPLVAGQIAKFAAFVPDAAQRAGDWLGVKHPQLLEQLRALMAPEDVGKLVGGGGALKTANFAVGAFGKGVSAALSFLLTLVLTPLVAFYFIRDRGAIGGELIDSLPPRLRPAVLEVFSDLDGVLDEFLHGQLVVILIMTALYSTILHLTDVPFALAIGTIAGVLVFVPYVGFMLGLVLATISGVGHFDDWTDFVLLWAVMGVGTTVESMIITPYFVGERVGLHPVTVLAAVLIAGEVFGFVGVLVSLPLAAVLLVLCRHLRHRYISSDFYASRD